MTETAKIRKFAIAVSLTIVSLSLSPSLSIAAQDAAASGKSKKSTSKVDKAKTASDQKSKKKTQADSTAVQDQADSSFDEVQSKAYVLGMDGKYDEAKKLIEEALKTKQSSSDKTSLHYLLSAIARMGDDYSTAVSNLEEVVKADSGKKDKESNLQRALLLKRLGDSYWGLRKTKLAIEYYNLALKACDSLPDADPLVPLLLESLTGTYVYNKDFKNAEIVGNKLLASTEEHAKSQDLDDMAALFWAKLQMLNIYRNTGNETERKKLWDNTFQLLERFFTLRDSLEQRGGMEELEAIKKLFEEKYITEFHPQTPAEYLWLASEFRMRSMPLIHWGPSVGSAKAAILCIHGLGLENRSFGDFGKEMKSRGYSVYAMDVRGFGSWQSAQGQEDVQFNESIKDIQAMLRIITTREKSIPVFLLGESMGGAIALRGAAAYGDQLAGVISSVPSAELFQQRRMGFSVAAHLLQGKNRPFRVGDMVTEQATANEALSDKWKKDFKAKMEMTPKELIKFAVFMRTTKKECELIKNTPVFVVQGLKDRLVKPEGTVSLFEAVKNEDKTLLIMGTAEHLIFETYKPSAMLLNTLTTWIDDHSKPAAKAGSDQAKP